MRAPCRFEILRVHVPQSRSAPLRLLQTTAATDSDRTTPLRGDSQSRPQHSPSKGGSSAGAGIGGGKGEVEEAGTGAGGGAIAQAALSDVEREGDSEEGVEGNAVTVVLDVAHNPPAIVRAMEKVGDIELEITPFLGALSAYVGDRLALGIN